MRGLAAQLARDGALAHEPARRSTIIFEHIHRAYAVVLRQAGRAGYDATLAVRCESGIVVHGGWVAGRSGLGSPRQSNAGRIVIFRVWPDLASKG